MHDIATMAKATYGRNITPPTRVGEQSDDNGASRAATTSLGMPRHCPRHCYCATCNGTCINAVANPKEDICSTCLEKGHKSFNYIP